MRGNRLSSIIAVLVALFTTTVTARWAVKCQAVLRDRIDPVHHPGELANAFNLFAGANAVNETVTYDQLQRSACSSCSTTGDMSLYWTPQLFVFDGTHYMFVPDNNITVHYDQSCPAVNKSDITALPFPEGFEMSAGHISKRRPANDVPDGAIRFECHDKHAPNGVRSTTATLPQDFCPDGLSAKIGFPSCWDGKVISSTDGSHVAYPVNGTCPSSHPKRLVSMWYEILYDLKSFKDKLGVDGRSSLVFVQKGLIGYDNDPTGYGFQGVFMNGWDTGLLQQAILYCQDQSVSANNTCSHVLSQTVRPSDFVSCAGTQHAPEAITAPASPTPTSWSPPSEASLVATPGFQTTSLATKHILTKTTASTLVSSTSSASSVAANPSSAPSKFKRDLEDSKRSATSLHPEFASFEEAAAGIPSIIERVSLTNGNFLGIKVCTPSRDPLQPPHCILLESRNAHVLGAEFIQWARRTDGFQWHESATLWQKSEPLHDHDDEHNIRKLRLGLWVILSTVPFFVGSMAFLLGMFIGETYSYNPINYLFMPEY